MPKEHIMIDPKLIRENKDSIQTKLEQRGNYSAVFKDYCEADKQWRYYLQEIDQLKMQRNQTTPKGKPSQIN